MLQNKPTQDHSLTSWLAGDHLRAASPILGPVVSSRAPDNPRLGPKKNSRLRRDPRLHTLGPVGPKVVNTMLGTCTFYLLWSKILYVWAGRNDRESVILATLTYRCTRSQLSPSFMCVCCSIHMIRLRIEFNREGKYESTGWSRVRSGKQNPTTGQMRPRCR